MGILTLSTHPWFLVADSALSPAKHDDLKSFTRNRRKMAESGSEAEEK